MLPEAMSLAGQGAHSPLFLSPHAPPAGGLRVGSQWPTRRRLHDLVCRLPASGSLSVSLSFSPTSTHPPYTSHSVCPECGRFLVYLSPPLSPLVFSDLPPLLTSTSDTKMHFVGVFAVCLMLFLWRALFVLNFYNKCYIYK